MSFSFCFDKEDDIYQFAYCYPYSYTRLQNYLDNLEKKNMDFFSRELLCLTVVCISLYFYYSVHRAIPILETIFNLLGQMPCKLQPSLGICCSSFFSHLIFFCQTARPNRTNLDKDDSQKEDIQICMNEGGNSWWSKRGKRGKMK